jgi:hypothetical protein
VGCNSPKGDGERARVVMTRNSLVSRLRYFCISKNTNLRQREISQMDPINAVMLAVSLGMLAIIFIVGDEYHPSLLSLCWSSKREQLWDHEL